ncbi:P-loop containing nucleoside triphosphate hydrolase protein [Trichophaea hybrida]|nr:P-loop containing nucleoside triphosphate hydrolase protein [Trichophaea hybrida]
MHPQLYPAPPSTSPAAPPQTQGWVPDVYSPTFVSEYQRSINTIPATPVRALPPPQVDFVRFIEHFAGRGFLTPLPPPPPLTEPIYGNPANGADGMHMGSGNVRRPEESSKKTTSSAPGTPELQKPSKEEFQLGPSNYGAHFSNLIFTEISTEDQIIQGYNLYTVPVIPQDLTQHMFQVFIPGIRENTPFVQLGDMVKLRQIRPSPMHYPGVFTGYEYEAYVYGMDKAMGYLVLKADGLWIEIGGRFNVIFGVQEQRWDGARRAVADVGAVLSAQSQNETLVSTQTPDETASGTKSTFLRRMLFPEESDGIMQHGLARGIFGRNWIDKELNYEQQKAVDSILKQNYGNVPYLISGPPGTGKTKTIVEAVLQLIYAPRAPHHHILLCAPSQEAADTLAIRLTKHLLPSALLRLQTSTRTFSEVPAKLMAYSYIEGDMFSIPAWKALMRFRVIVCSCRDASILVEARCTNRDLGYWEKHVVDSLRGIADNSSEFVERGEFVRLHWTALLLDEAAQGIEPEVAIPLSVIAPPEEVSDDTPIVVMAGDQKQLGPNIVTKGDLRISAFERLFARPIYSKHPLRRELYTDNGMKNTRGHIEELSADRKAKLLPYLYPPFTNLVRNYRSHSAILAVPSAFFYNDTLIPEAKGTHRLEKWTGWKGTTGIPVKFILNSGHDESYEEAISFYNLREVQIAVKAVQSLLSPGSWPTGKDGEKIKMGPIQQNEIAVMSPFREQVKRLRKAMSTPPCKGVNIGPIEAYQGSEFRFVIICTTRARERFLKNDAEKGAGLIFEHRRANVALTRAKEGLVVIGNPWILEKDPLWTEWMSFAWRHDAVEFDLTGNFSTSKAVTSRSEPESNKENQDPKATAAISSVCTTANTYASVIQAGSSKPVNEWKPRGGDLKLSSLVSRLEDALVFKSKARKGAVFGRKAGWDEDDPMFLAGIAAEEEVRREVVDEGDEPGYGLGNGV